MIGLGDEHRYLLLPCHDVCHIVKPSQGSKDVMKEGTFGLLCVAQRNTMKP